MIIAAFLILIFIVFAAVMYTGKLPVMISLPLLAVAFSVVAGIPYYFHQAASPSSFTKLKTALVQTQNLVFNVVIADGIPRLHIAIMAVILGSIFGYCLKTTGVSETMVKYVAELGGDNPFTITLFLTAVVGILFTSLGGLGSIIMVANIYFPILLSLSIPPLLIGSIFLMAISFGGIFNLTNWTLYTDILGLTQQEITRFALPMAGISFVIFIVFIPFEFKKARVDVPVATLVKFSIILGLLGCLIWTFTNFHLGPEVLSI